MNINRLSRYLLYVFSVITLAACSVAQKNQAAAPTALSPRKTETTTAFMPTPAGTPTVSAPRCQPPGYPGTIHYENGDAFGDGHISRILVSAVGGKSEEEIVHILVTQWLEHYKTQSKSASATIKDYAIGTVNMLDPSCDPFFEFVADVRFSILPVQIPNAYAAFPSGGVNPNSGWWHISAPFGVFRDSEDYRLRLVFGWGT